MGAQPEVQDHAVGLEAPSAKRLKTQFRCSKCGFVTDDNARFQQHIPQHKSDENTPQCLHCGLCFTSVLSLNRHLFIVHKVKDPEEGEQEGGDVREKNNQQIRTAETDQAKDSLPELTEFEPSHAEDPESLHKTTDCNLILSAHSQSQAVSLC